MIVSRSHDRLRLITQGDHAHFSAELLSLWKGQNLPDHPWRTEILRATRSHDNGWRELDAAPPLDPGTGHPWDFVDLPGHLRAELWQHGVERMAGEPVVAALVAMHALAIHSSGSPGVEIQELRAWLEEHIAELLEDANISRHDLEQSYIFLDWADAASLASCGVWDGRFGKAGLRGRFSAGVLELDPFPLVGATTFHIAYREIPARRYGGEADLGGELGAAKWRQMPVKVAPTGPSSR